MTDNLNSETRRQTLAGSAALTAPFAAPVAGPTVASDKTAPPTIGGATSGFLYRRLSAGPMGEITGRSGTWQRNLMAHSIAAASGACEE